MSNFVIILYFKTSMSMYSIYEEWVKELNPDINEHDLNNDVDKNFATWFENYVSV